METISIRTPDEIAQRLQYLRSDLVVSYGNSGGGIMTIEATRRDEYGKFDIPNPERIIIGTASGNLGFSDETGDQFGEAVGLVADHASQEAWDTNQPLSQATEILVYLLTLLEQFMPRRVTRNV